MADNVPYDIYRESPNNSLLRQTGQGISDVFLHTTAALYSIITLKISDNCQIYNDAIKRYLILPDDFNITILIFFFQHKNLM